MKKIFGSLGNVLGFVLFMVVLVAFSKWTGWSFGNLFFGPTYQAEPRSQQAPLPPPAGQVIAEYKRRAWWLPEYSTLNAALDQAGGHLLVSYRTGPQGQAVVNDELRRGPDRGLTLIIDSPPQSVNVRDETTGRLVPEDHRSVFTLRDTDLDGMPDQVRMEPAGKPMPGESFTTDGFMRVRDSTEHDVFFTQWMISLGYCTNHFLHGKESAFP